MVQKRNFAARVLHPGEKILVRNLSESANKMYKINHITECFLMRVWCLLYVPDVVVSHYYEPIDYWFPAVEKCPQRAAIAGMSILTSANDHRNSRESVLANFLGKHDVFHFTFVTSCCRWLFPRYSIRNYCTYWSMPVTQVRQHATTMMNNVIIRRRKCMIRFGHALTNILRSASIFLYAGKNFNDIASNWKRCRC